MITLGAIKKYFINLENQNSELIWAKTWDDTKKGIKWIEDMPGISPGRWAVGYNYLYVMTRILNEKKPHNILDIGLGISSTLISHYFDYYQFEDGNHSIVEHDNDWVKFYLNNNKLSKASNINVLECVQKEINGYAYNAYNGLEKVVNNKKFDVISIDAPKESYMYSRRDVLEFMPEILSDSFVIIMDDSQRLGEKKTIEEIKTILSQNEISYCEGIYPGMTSCHIVTSLDNKFLCTL